MYLKFSLALKQGYYPLKVGKDTLQEKSSLLIRHFSLVFVCLLLWTTISYSEFARSLMGYVPNEHAFAKGKIQCIPWPPSIPSGYEHKRRRGICHKEVCQVCRCIYSRAISAPKICLPSSSKTM